MEKTGKKPNIIMILADDQGPGRCTAPGHRSFIRPTWTELQNRECGLTASSVPRRYALRRGHPF